MNSQAYFSKFGIAAAAARGARVVQAGGPVVAALHDGRGAAALADVVVGVLAAEVALTGTAPPCACRSRRARR